MRPKKLIGYERLAVGFTGDQCEWLRKEAKRLRIPVSEFVRRIVDEKREEERRK